MRKTFKLLVITMLLIACNKDNDSIAPIDQLPEATQTGEDTFGCLVNGEAFVDSYMQSVFYQSGLLHISGTIDAGDDGYQVRMVISESAIGDVIKVNQTYNLYNDSNMMGEYLKYEGGACFYDTDESYTGSITITHFDQTNFIISGTFEFDAISDTCDGIINVTDGRFDLRYTP